MGWAEKKKGAREEMAIHKRRRVVGPDAATAYAGLQRGEEAGLGQTRLAAQEIRTRALSITLVISKTRVTSRHNQRTKQSCI